MNKLKSVGVNCTSLRVCGDEVDDTFEEKVLEDLLAGKFELIFTAVRNRQYRDLSFVWLPAEKCKSCGDRWRTLHHWVLNYDYHFFVFLCLIVFLNTFKVISLFYVRVKNVSYILNVPVSETNMFYLYVSLLSPSHLKVFNMKLVLESVSAALWRFHIALCYKILTPGSRLQNLNYAKKLKVYFAWT